MTMYSYRGHIYATKGTVLGGVLSNTSTPFATRNEAISWLAQALAVNRGAGRQVNGEIQTLLNGKVIGRAKVETP